MRELPLPINLVGLIPFRSDSLELTVLPLELLSSVIGLFVDLPLEFFSFFTEEDDELVVSDFVLLC